jgi:hypothetical protein
MTSFLLSIRGGWADPPNTDEIWQIGIRLWMDQSVPDNIGTFPDIDIADTYETGTETWGTWSTNWAYTGALDIGDYFGTIVDAWTTFFNDSKFVDQCQTLQFRLYPIDSTGHVVQLDSGAAAAIAIPSTPILGTSGGNVLPLEVACVATWDTYRMDRRGKGRVYLPGTPAANLTEQGRYGSGFRADVATDMAAFLSAIGLDPLTPGDIHVRPVVTGPSNWDAYSVIRRVRCGDVPDSQRRRRNRLQETYSSADTTY